MAVAMGKNLSIELHPFPVQSRMPGQRHHPREGRKAVPRKPKMPRALLAAILPLVFSAALFLGGCDVQGEGKKLAAQARALWEAGVYGDAARNFVTLADLYPNSPLAEESLYLAASLYHHYIRDPEQAARLYQNLAVAFPKGRYFFEARENLAVVYEASDHSRHRALQIYQQLLLAPEMAGRADYLRFKIGELNLQLGKMDQARLEFRDLLVKRPDSIFAPQTYYLVGFSYYLEKRFDLALAVFRGTARKFPGTPIAIRAEFFVADTLEDLGEMRRALKSFRALKDHYPFPEIINTRIRTLQARIRRGVR